MKKLVLLSLLLLFTLSACGSVGTLSETVYEPEPIPTSAPEFTVRDYFSSEEMEQELQHVEYSYGHAGFQISLPEDWHYEIVAWSEETPEFGLDFCPSGSGDGRLRLRCYGGMFGVCGTGLAESEGELPGTGKLRVGYYDGQTYPSFISFHDSPGGWALTNELGTVWSTHESEIEKILGSLVLDAGVMRVSEAETMALEYCRWDYDYIRTEFDVHSGSFSLGFVKSGGELQGGVAIEKNGDEYIVITDE